MGIDRYKLILDFATEGFWDWDLKADRAYLSPRYCAMIGYSPDDTVFDTAFLKKIIYPDDLQRVFQVIEEYLQGKRNTSVVEHRMITKDGTIRWMEARCNVVEYDEQGKPSRMVGTIIDITERKLAEMERGQYFNFFTTSSELMCIAGLDGYFKKTNPSFSRTLGYSEEELLARPLIEFIHPDDRQPTANEIARQLNGAIVTAFFENRYLGKDGIYRWLSWNAYFDEDKKLIFGIARDITEQKRVAEEISHSQKLLSSIIDNAPYAIFVKDVNDDFRTLLWNKSSETIFGLPAAAVLGKNSGDVVPREQAKAYLADDRSVVSNRTALDIPEEPGTHHGKGEIFLHTRKIPLFDNNGNVSHIVVICEDITEHRKIHAGLIKSQKLESLGVLAGGIAHDFNNILQVIMGYCSIAKKRPESDGIIVPEIEKAVCRGAELCGQMLAYAGKSKFVLTRINMEELVMDTVSIVKPLISQNAVIKLNCLSDIPLIKADASQIKQIVMNLIINSSEAIGEAHGEIIVSLSKTAIRAEQSDKDHLGKVITPGLYVCLEVADNGCGMDDETMRRIFEPFYSTKFTGRGLGMSAVLGIITSHNGALQLYSRQGQGTTLKVYLPGLIHDSIEDESPQQIAPPQWQGRGTILLVEDEEQINAVAKAFLEELGFSVITASNGKEALEMYQKNATDITIVLTDVGMPIMNGYELFRELKKLNPELPIIISSGFGEADVLSRIAREDIKGLIAKPYSFNQLREVLKGVVESASEA